MSHWRRFRNFRNLTGRSRSELAARALFAFAVVCFAWVAWVLADTAVAEAYHGWRLDAAIEEQKQTAASPTHGSAEAVLPAEWEELEEGTLIGRIEIERLGIGAVVLEGVGSRTLRRAVGRIPTTALPGDDGNIGLAGHRDSFFRELGGVRPGDRIVLTTPRDTYEYVVDTTFVVEPEDVHVLDPPASGQMITLVTCYPFYQVGPAPDRFIVQARRVDRPSTPGGTFDDAG